MSTIQGKNKLIIQVIAQITVVHLDIFRFKMSNFIFFKNSEMNLWNFARLFFLLFIFLNFSNKNFDKF